VRKLGVEEWLLRVNINMYYGLKTSVRVNGVLSEDFIVKVGVHQRFVLSLLLFIMVLEVLSSSFRIDCCCCST